ncbi:MAG: TonB-dependent receptor [Acidobacteria bacterium]|nr:TonB-dependent receptor [Acidobacteriota bacterium]
MAAAQSGRAELLGTVTDPAGLPVATAQVALSQPATSAHYQTVTSASGAWDFSGLLPGVYQLEIRKPGFEVLRRPDIQLRVADRVVLDLSLVLGDFSQTLEVTAAAPLVQNTTGTLSLVVGQEQVSTLPLNGRNFIPLIALSPGVMLPPGQFLPRINGSRPRTSEYLYDGVSVLQPEPGQVAYYPVLDSIGEFRVETNSYSAEYGRSNGGVIQVSSKAGTNDFHGSLFEYFRNEALNARNLFAAAGPKPLFRRNLFGGTLGGPIRRGQTFFFADWQSIRLDTGVTRLGTVPTLAQRAGVFTTDITDPLTRTLFPNRTIPTSRFDTAAGSVLSSYPLPNASGSSDYRRAADNTDGTDQFDTRIDHYIGTRQRIFARYSYLRDHIGAPATFAPADTTTITRGDSLIVEHAIGGNQARLGYTRRSLVQSTAQPGATYDIAGFQSLGPATTTNGHMSTSVTEFVDDYAFNRGAHSLKVGADLRWEHLNVFQPPFPSGDYQFTAALTGNSFASFLLGAVQNYSRDVQQDTLRPRAHITEFFVQDDWRVTPRLTLSPGVRYTLNFPSTEADNRIAVFNLATRKLDFPQNARNLHKHDFGPRMGLAYRLSDSSAIRAGYGLVWIEQAGITTPFTAPMFPFIQTLAQSSLDNITPAFYLAQGASVQAAPPSADSGLGQGVFGVQRETGSGYAQQWNVTLERNFGTSWTASVGYAGSKLTGLGVPDTNLNQLPVSAFALGTALTQRVANPFYGMIPAATSLGAPTIAEQQLLRRFPRFTTVTLYRNNVGNSTWHALEAHLERRFSRSLAATFSYTFSKLIDDAGSVFSSALLTGPVANYQAADSYNRRLEKDESNGSIPHVFSAGVVWQPRRWEASVILKAQSGMPFTVQQATNYNAAFGFGIQRPNIVGNPALPADARSTARFFNTAAFTQAGQFAIGTASRNPVRGPGYSAVDLMIGRLFPIRESLTAELRGEVFNLTNTPPLGQPNGTFGSAAFGSITSAGDPRVFEFSARLQF